MFSFQQSDDHVFDEILQQDLLVDLHDHVTILEGNKKDQQANKARKKHGDLLSFKLSSATNDGVKDGNDDHRKRKLIHREVEKQRRKEMAMLYSTLKILLPLEFIKGKRSIPDHMQQAVNYIKYLQEKIEVLGVQRDQLKNLNSMTSSSMMLMNTNENFRPNTVSIDSCNGIIEILISSCSIQNGFLLSKVLKALVEEGLNVVNCTTTQVCERFLHSIQSEVNDPVRNDPSLLLQKLTAIANNHSSFNN